jgi:hypothetical protein
MDPRPIAKFKRNPGDDPLVAKKGNWHHQVLSSAYSMNSVTKFVLLFHWVQRIH